MIKKRAVKNKVYKKKKSKRKTFETDKISSAYKERVARLKHIIWLGWIPRIVGLTFGILWFLFGILESITSPAQWYIGIAEGLIIGGGILITTWVLFKKELTGAIIFSAEAALVFSLLMFRRISHSAAYLALGIPLLVIAMLAFIHFFVVKQLIEEHNRK